MFTSRLQLAIFKVLNTFTTANTVNVFNIKTVFI